MKASPSQNGPWGQRLLIYFFSGLFGLLVFWLLGFVVRDIDTWRGPTWEEVESRLRDPALRDGASTVRGEIEQTTRSINNHRQRQAALRDSASNSERTMNQLLQLQKLTLEKSLSPTPAETEALATSQQLFLANQSKYQEINEQVSALSEQLLALQNRERDIQKSVDAQTPEIQAEFARLRFRHEVKIAASKLAALLPLLGLASWFYFKRRSNLYAPLLNGFGLALIVRVGLVMHQHFPERYFKYILIAISIAIVARILVHLIQSRAFPKAESLLKQYRDAYEHFLCPVCEHPIRRGALKFLFWTRRSLKNLRVPESASNPPDEPYVCPVCATQLFEECPHCKATRHSLLPACCHCGDAKSFTPTAAVPPSATA